MIANFEGYFNDLLAFVESAQQKGFIYPGHLERVMVAGEPDDVIKALAACEGATDPLLNSPVGRG